MAETLLKKEFQERDVNRLRNILTKKHGNATGVQVGYQKATEDYKEGDYLVSISTLVIYLK